MTSLLLEIGRLTLAVFLAISAATKLADYSNSRAAIAVHVGFKLARQLLPPLIFIEGLCAALLLVDADITVVAVATGGLFVGFTAFTAYLAATDRTLSRADVLGLRSRVGARASALPAMRCLPSPLSYWQSDIRRHSLLRRRRMPYLRRSP